MMPTTNLTVHGRIRGAERAVRIARIVVRVPLPIWVKVRLLRHLLGRVRVEMSLNGGRTWRDIGTRFTVARAGARLVLDEVR